VSAKKPRAEVTKYFRDEYGDVKQLGGNERLLAYSHRLKLRNRGVDATDSEVADAIAYLRQHPNLLDPTRAEGRRPFRKAKEERRKTPKVTEEKPRPKTVRLPPPAPIPELTPQAPQPPVHVPKPSTLAATARNVLSTLPAAKDATLLGRLVLGIPPLLPALVMGAFTVGVFGLAGSFLVGGDTMGLVEYATRFSLGLLAALANAVLLAANAVLTGLSLALKLLVAGVLAFFGRVFDTLFGALFDAVNHLIAATPGLEGEVAKPRFDAAAVAPGTLLRLRYLAPGDLAGCAAPLAPVDVTEDGLRCAASWIATGSWTVGDAFDLPHNHVTVTLGPASLRDALDTLLRVTGGGLHEVADWVRARLGGST
jgi:hypothetical protein